MSASPMRNLIQTSVEGILFGKRERNMLNFKFGLLQGRCGGLVVSVLDSGLRGPGSSPDRVIVLCSWAKHFTLTVPLSPPRSINWYQQTVRET